MDLASFLGKLLEDDDVDVLREGVRLLAQAIMDAEVSAQLGAGLRERSPERTAHRNDYRTGPRTPELARSICGSPRSRQGATSPGCSSPAGELNGRWSG